MLGQQATDQYSAALNGLPANADPSLRAAIEGQIQSIKTEGYAAAVKNAPGLLGAAVKSGITSGPVIAKASEGTQLLIRAKRLTLGVRESVAEQPQQTIIVVPPQPAPNITVNMAPPEIDMDAFAAALATISSQEQEAQADNAPLVEAVLSLAREVSAQKPPVVNVPEQPPAQVVVNIPEESDRETIPERDADGNILRTVTRKLLPEG